MMPLYKYPINTDPYYSYLTSTITLWFIAGPALIGIGLLLEIIERKSIPLEKPHKNPRNAKANNEHARA